MKEKLKRIVAYFISAVMIFTSVFIVDGQAAKAEEGGISFTLSLSCANGTTPPGNYDVAYELVNGEGNIVDIGYGQRVNKQGASDGSEVSLQCTISADEVTTNNIASVKISVTNAGYDIYYNGIVDNSWTDGKTISVAELAGSYAFQLQASQPNPQPNPQPDTSTKSGIPITIVNPQSGKVSYKVNGGGWNEISGNSFTLRNIEELGGIDNGTIYLKAIPNDGQSLDNGDRQNRINDTQIPLNELNSDSGYAFTYDSSQNYSVQIAFAAASGGSSGGNTPQDPPSGTRETVNLTVSWSGSFGEIKVGGESVDLNNTSQHFSELRVNGDMIDVSIQTEPTIEFSSIKINGEEKLSSGERKESYSFQISKTDTSLSIEVVTAQSNTFTIQWAYDNTFGDDALVENGTVEMLSGYKTGDDTYWHVESGSIVRVKLIPKYGYQVIGAKINDVVDLTAENESNEFTFEMPSSHVHFKGIFKETSDIVENSSLAVSGATFSGDVIANTGGTAKMTISNAEPSNTAGVSGTIDETKSVQAVDIRMDQLFYKNSAEDVWSTNKTELDNSAEVKLTVNQSAGGYAVLREHNGTVEEIEASYNASDNTITFLSDKYSTYTLVPLVGSPSQDPEPTPQPDEPANNTSSASSNQPSEEVVEAPQPIGDVVGGVAIQNWGDLEKVLDTKEASAPAETKPASNTIAELVQIKLKNNNTTVPSSTFSKLSKSDSSGLHLFTGNGTALTFMNDAKIAVQKTINVACTTVAFKERKEINFKEYTRLNTTVMLHANVPAGTKKVSVYFTDENQKKTLLTTIEPTQEGRLCFFINQLGKYELVYNQ